MKRFFLDMAFVLAAMAVLAGCDVHQWPEIRGDQEPVPEPGTADVVIPLRLEYDTDFYLWEHKYDPLLGLVEPSYPSLSVYPGYPGASSKYDNMLPSGRIQVSVKVYSTKNPSRCIAEKTFERNIDGIYDEDLEMAVKADGGAYNIVVWSHLLATSQESPYYDASSFSNVHVVLGRYTGNTDYRDGFSGQVSVDAAAEPGKRYVVRMKRPMGKLELVTTDLSEFLDRETEVRGLSTRASVEDYRVIVSFPRYYPSSYNVIENRLVNAVSGVSFETTMTVTGISEASLGFDYVMLNNNADNGVQTQVDVYRLDGTRVAGSSVFTIPMRRDYHTLLRGAFLSLMGNGGVGIDPGFNGDHNVMW